MTVYWISYGIVAAVAFVALAGWQREISKRRADSAARQIVRMDAALTALDAALRRMTSHTSLPPSESQGRDDDSPAQSACSPAAAARAGHSP